ncbi:DUF7002 family protein [Paenibacillus sp. GCM10012306]|uniref:DUF7002 family protein n=1 Tax=Paenibacillus sp. GCM10012306 TaxID=3317342 RepID=UPI003617F200
MDISIVADITKSPLRRSLYHFTRASNLQAIAHFDALYSPSVIAPHLSKGIRRSLKHSTLFNEQSVVLNAHLRITDDAMDPSTTPEQFRTCLDRHVFLWPTKRDCLTMLGMYSRREPDESFAVLQLDAAALLTDHFDVIALSKYDSGSSPRYPHRMSYRKSCEMFLPLHRFKQSTATFVPSKPSEIKEILVAGPLTPLSKYLQTIYCTAESLVPLRWNALAKPLATLHEDGK